MNKNDLWKVYSDKNPSFNGSANIEISPVGLKKLFEQTWDIAYKAGQDQNKKATETINDFKKKYMDKDKSSEASSLWGKFFGK